MCEQLQTPTLTIPVDPGPGPDLTEIQINPQPFQWGCGDVRSAFGWWCWLSCGRWALAKELCNGWCKHQDCSQALCNLLLYIGIYKRSPWLCPVPSQRSCVRSTLAELRWCCLWNFTRTLCLLAERAVQYLHHQQAQNEAGLSLALTLSSSSPHAHSSLLASMELQGLGKEISSGLCSQLSPAQLIL